MTLQLAIIEITQRCNLKCKGCYINDIRPKNRKQMSIKTFKEIVDKLPSKTLIVISGGEPFLHKGIVEMARYVKGRVSVFTSGAIFNPILLKELSFISRLEITLSYPREEWDNDFRGGNVFDNTIKNLDYCNRNKIKTIIHFVAHKDNQFFLEKMNGIAEEFDTKILLLPFIPNEKFKYLALSLKEWRKFYKKTKRYDNVVWGMNEKYCLAGISRIAVGVGGSIFPCLEENTLIQLSNGDIKKIKDLKIGDKILSFNEKTRKIEKDVCKDKRKFEKEVFEVITTKGTIYATEEHPFYVYDGKIKTEILKNIKIKENLILLSNLKKYLNYEVPKIDEPIFKYYKLSEGEIKKLKKRLIFLKTRTYKEIARKTEELNKEIQKKYNQVKYLRDDKKLIFKEIGKKLGIGRTTAMDWYHGKSKPRRCWAREIKKRLKLDIPESTIALALRNKTYNMNKSHINEISKRIGIGYSTLRGFLNGRHGMSFRGISVAYRELNLKLDKTKLIPSRNPRRINFPGVSPELFRLFGYFISDGYITSKLHCFGICDEDLERLNYYGSLIEKFFNVETVLIKNGKTYKMIVSSKSLCIYFKKFYNDRMFNSHTKSIPQFILKSSDEYIREFLCGFFDAEGYIIKQKENIRAVFSGQIENLIKIKYLLLRFGIISSRVRKVNSEGIGYNLVILKSSIKDFFNLIQDNFKIKNSKVSKEQLELRIDRRKKLNKNLIYEKIRSIKSIGIKNVYDITTLKNHNFIADTFLVHNCVYLNDNLGNILKEDWDIIEKKLADWRLKQGRLKKSCLAQLRGWGL